MPVSNRRFVVTGKMSRTRQAMEADIEAAGGIVQDQVDYSTDYIIVGKRPGSKKLNGGEQRNKPFLTENEYWQMRRDATYLPQIMNRTQAVLYADTLDNNGSPVRPMADVSAAGPVRRQSSYQAPAAAQREPDRFSIAEFFEEE